MKVSGKKRKRTPSGRSGSETDDVSSDSEEDEEVEVDEEELSRWKKDPYFSDCNTGVYNPLRHCT